MSVWNKSIVKSWQPSFFTLASYSIRFLRWEMRNKTRNLKRQRKLSAKAWAKCSHTFPKFKMCTPAKFWFCPYNQWRKIFAPEQLLLIICSIPQSIERCYNTIYVTYICPWEISQKSTNKSIGTAAAVNWVVFKLVDLAISATPIADRCIQLSIQPCNLHRQTLAVEWPYWRAQWLSTWHHHLSNNAPLSSE
jgi:hypothetical protein